MTTQMTIEEEVRTFMCSRLSAAKYEIDQAFYRGYAEKHPELVAAYLQAATYEKRTILQERAK